MHLTRLSLVALGGICALSACSSSTPVMHTPIVAASTAPTTAPSTAPSTTPSTTPSTAPSTVPSTAPTAQPQVVHVGFNQTTATDPTFGEIAYYSLTAGAAATPITVASGSQIVFMADTTSPR